MQHLAPSKIAAARFLASVKQTIAKQFSATDLIVTAEELSALGEASLLLELYKIWISHNADSPLLQAIYFNYGVLLTSEQQLEQARQAFEEAIRLAPDFMPPYINCGSALERLGMLPEAIERWLAVARRLPAINGDGIHYKTTALKQVGRVLEGAHDPQRAEEALRQSLEIDPSQRDVAQHWISLRQGQCRWPVIAPWGRVTRTALMEAISPLSVEVYADDPMLHLATANRYYRHDVAPGVPVPVVGAWPARPRPSRLKIGYLSSDLRSHAVGFLTGEVFGLHDRARVQVHAYYCGPDLHDQTRERIAGSVDGWTTITGLDDRQAATRMIDDEIDILIDLNGYTKDARPKLIALRPAPIIVNWLGFPGSAGSPHHHYIIADDYVIPPGQECFYSERVLRLPCYQPNDRQRIVAAERPSRAAAGLPDDAVVFCCFNGSQKLTRATFRRMMTILREVPGSVLWMLAGNDDTNGRLQVAAEALGVARERLVFAPRRSNPDHLARYPLADLFLDTYPYGAHTTASDALWMGVPILTLAGRAFASRVCGSLATAAGLPELVCDDADAFIQLAVQLGRDRPRLQALRQRLQASRTSCTLFDTPRLVAHLEALYEQMWRDYAEGTLPVADLTNLETYGEIGCELDHEADEDRLERPAAGYYEQALRFRHAISPLPADGRLWQAGLADRVAAA